MSPILELVAEIIEEGKYKKGNKNEEKLNTIMKKLFKLHSEQGTEESARRIHQEIITIARLGKGSLAN